MKYGFHRDVDGKWVTLSLQRMTREGGWEAEPGRYYRAPLRKCTEPRRVIRTGIVEKQ